MDTARREEGAQYDGEGADNGASTLLRPMSTLSIGSICTCAVVGMLATLWCILDYWNREITHDLFSIGNIRTVDMDNDGVPEVVTPFTNFNYPLTLAFLQFVFMGIFFLCLHFSMTQERPQDLARLQFFSDKRWPVMVISHVFSTFWLQALMMPAQMLSLPMFAASRAAEIPAAAAFRCQVIGAREGKKRNMTVGLACLAAAWMFFSYAKLAGCVCIWSGSGVALSGFAFWLIYLLMLAMPAANAVCQEAIMLQPGMHPLLLLALQNIFACVIFGPILVICHMIGWEDVGGAFVMMLTYSEVFMLVLWLCAQMAATSLLCITLIHIVDSFWMITLRALRVIFWAISMLGVYYMSGPGMPVSIGCPYSSFWYFLLLGGGFVLGCSAYIDRAPDTEETTEKHDAKWAPAAAASASNAP